jgi:hypothetical protein
MIFNIKLCNVGFEVLTAVIMTNVVKSTESKPTLVKSSTVALRVVRGDEKGTQCLGI